jgi:membrane associated rhomboid family serine protease
MRSAAVGFQCPDDVAAGAKTVREGRTVFGGRVSGDTSKVSIALVALNVLVFVAGLALGERQLQEAYGNLPGPVLLSDGSLGGVAIGEYYRLLTAAFLHGGPFHLA